MDIMSFFSKILPPEKQKALSEALALLQEKNIANDLNLALTEIEKALAASSQNATEKRLKDAFNDAASLSSIGKDYLKTRNISMLTAAKLMANKGQYKESAQVLRDAFKAQHPSTLAYIQSLRANDNFYNAVKRLIVNTNQRLFRLEEGENGGGYAVELLTGRSMRVPLQKEQYEEIKAALTASQKNPPKPPTP
jgi:type I restriction-modification system DNA methylase subunit